MQARFRAQCLRESILIDEEEESQVRGRKIVREPRRSVIPAASAGERNIRWLVDTGCPIDLVGMNELNDSERYLISRSFPGHSLRTANGITGTNGRIDASAEHLPDRIEARILPTTPALISVGKRCMEMGYSFRWDAGQLPELISSNGTVTTLEVINNVPYLPRSTDGLQKRWSTLRLTHTTHAFHFQCGPAMLTMLTETGW